MIDDAIRARHVHAYEPEPRDVLRCIGDGQPWPCDTAVVLAALDVALAQLSGAVPSDGEPQPRATVEASDDPALDAAIEREARLRAAAADHGVCSCVALSGGEGPRPIGGGRFYHYQGCDNDPDLRVALATTPEPRRNTLPSFGQQEAAFGPVHDRATTPEGE